MAHGSTLDRRENSKFSADGFYKARPLPWIRPSDWSAPPNAMTTSSQMFQGLMAVYPDGSNYIALSAEGDFTVDWGDGGPPENVSSNVTAEHTYDYSALGGSPTSEGFKLVWIVLTPDGGNLTKLDVNRRHSKTGLVGGHGTPWLEWHIGSPNFASGRSIVTTTGSSSIAANTVLHHTLRNCVLYNIGAVTDIAAFFLYCHSLRRVDTDLINTSAITSFTAMFYSCNALQELPWMDTSSCTTFQVFAFNCTALRVVPQYDMSAATAANGLTQAFSACSSMERYPGFRMPTSGNVTATNMFQNNTSLLEGPRIDTTRFTSAASMFTGCAAMVTIPTYNFSNLTTGGSIFKDCKSLRDLGSISFPALSGSNAGTLDTCSSLTRIGDISFGNATAGASQFTVCFALEEIGDISYSTGNTLNNFFSSCRALRKIKSLTVGTVTTTVNMYSGCYSLIEDVAISVGSSTNNSTMYTNCLSLTKVNATGFTRTISIAGTKLDRDAIVTFFTNLGTAAGSQTVTVTNTPGASDLSGADIAIATGKGWTVAT